MKFKKFLALTAVLAVTATVFSFRVVRQSLPGAVKTGETQRAFRNADWGMTLQEVEKANGATLVPAPSGRSLLQQIDADPKHFIFYEQEGLKFLGRDATVAYTFRDSRLFAYHVFLSDTNATALDADVRRYLIRAFGSNSSESGDDTALKLVWQSKDRIVNYWFMEEDLSLRPKYTAVFGVTTG